MFIIMTKIMCYFRIINFLKALSSVSFLGLSISKKFPLYLPSNNPKFASPSRTSPPPMKHLLLIITFLITTSTIKALTISGTVTDQTKKPVAGANVFIKDSYDGASADANGKYSFTTDMTGTIILACHQLGFDDVEKTITLNGSDVVVDFILQGKVSEMDVVTISAGTIEASDEKRTTVLKPLDIVTTAGGEGDIYGALKTLPGAQQVGESEGLFVR